MGVGHLVAAVALLGMGASLVADAGTALLTYRAGSLATFVAVACGYPLLDVRSIHLLHFAPLEPGVGDGLAHRGEEPRVTGQEPGQVHRDPPPALRRLVQRHPRGGLATTGPISRTTTSPMSV